MTQILGHNYIGGQRSVEGSVIAKSVDASTGETLGYDFHQATLDEVDPAARAAATAYQTFRELSAERRAEFLDAIADELDALGDEFVAVVCRETALPAGRIQGERGCASGQMRLFAKVLRRGDFYGERIDQALPDRTPLPRPDLRQYRIGLGPVVFKAHILLNGYPTGVEVCDSVVHGGPYPTTSDVRGTSVGTLAIDRFLRPVCFQSYPDSLLPYALKNNNPLGIQRLLDGHVSDRSIG